MWTTDDLADDHPLCTVCRQALTGDPDDEPTHPAGPMCGDCYRARAFDDQLWALGGADGEDGLW